MRCYEIKADEYYHLTDLEILALREDFKSAMSEARKYIQEQHCECVFSQEEIKRLVDLTKEPSYRLPSGLSREERLKWISDIGSKLLTQNSEEGMLVNA